MRLTVTGSDRPRRLWTCLQLGHWGPVFVLAPACCLPRCPVPTSAPSLCTAVCTTQTCTHPHAHPSLCLHFSSSLSCPSLEPLPPRPTILLHAPTIAHSTTPHLLPTGLHTHLMPTITSSTFTDAIAPPMMPQPPPWGPAPICILFFHHHEACGYLGLVGCGGAPEPRHQALSCEHMHVEEAQQASRRGPVHSG